jgi:hypothetical protein
MGATIILHFLFLGSADAGLDFNPDIPDIITLMPSQPMVCVNVSILADDELEGTEQFFLEFTTAMPQRVVRSAPGILIDITG